MRCPLRTPGAPPRPVCVPRRPRGRAPLPGAVLPLRDDAWACFVCVTMETGETKYCCDVNTGSAPWVWNNEGRPHNEGQRRSKNHLRWHPKCLSRSRLTTILTKGVYSRVYYFSFSLSLIYFYRAIGGLPFVIWTNVVWGGPSSPGQTVVMGLVSGTNGGQNTTSVILR